MLLLLRVCFPGPVVNQLATELAALKEKGVAKPYIFVDLHKYLPRWATSEASDRDGEIVCGVAFSSGLVTSHAAGDVGEISAEASQMAAAAAAAVQAAGIATKPAARKAPLNYTQWLLAYDRSLKLSPSATGACMLCCLTRYAIAAAVTGMCSYPAALAHKVRRILSCWLLASHVALCC